jgi:glycosyltransferase involved in cell wall biosynthesis
MNRELTIVIPCKNEGDNILEVLKLIQKQQIICKVVIADSSDDHTVDLLQSQKSKLVKVIKGGLPAVARNNGAKLVTTPYVLFLDADIYLHGSKILSNCLDIAIKGSYDLVTCKFKTTEPEYDWIYRVFDIVQWISSKTKPFAVGGFMLFKTETFNKLGGFNEEDKIAEDYHISSKIKPSRFRITSNVVYTPGRRFANKGLWYMIKLTWLSWLNRNNDDWFKQDYNYWK